MKNDDIVEPPKGTAKLIFSTPTAEIYHQITGNWFTPNLYYWMPVNAPINYPPHGGFLTLEACIKHHEETLKQAPANTAGNVIYVDFKAKKRIT